MGQIPADVLRELEVEAYSAVMKALYAGTYDLEKEELLTKLRESLHVNHTMHAEVLAAVKEDLQALREGRAVESNRSRFLASGSAGASRRAPARPVAVTHASSKTRPNATRQRAPKPQSSRGQRNDPYGYVGRRVWRHWSSENPPWVEGFVYEYEPETGLHSILYDPNQGEAETLEEGFSFVTADPQDYVLGDFVDIKSVMGSRRVADRPMEVSIPPPQSVTPAPLTDRAPSKKRKTNTSAAIPQFAPFNEAWFNSKITQVASEDELSAMLVVLERREIESETELSMLQEDILLAGDHAKRVELERELADLCDREEILMSELAGLRSAE